MNHKLKAFSVLVLCLPLAACFGDREAKTADCEFKTLAVTGDRDWSVPQRRMDEIKLMTLCMKVAGYEFNTESYKCGYNLGRNGYIDPFCYVPIDAIDYWADRLGRWREFYLAKK